LESQKSAIFTPKLLNYIARAPSRLSAGTKNPAADKCLSTFLLPQKGYEKQINATMLITVQTLSIPLIMSFGKLL
jgi:hypothetical protein